MRLKMKKFLGIMLSLALMLGLLPGMSLSAYAAGVSYVDSSGTSQTVEATELEAATTNWTNGSWYIVPAGGVTISSRIAVNGTVNLILRDGATLTASAGITVIVGNTLNIYAQSAGTGALSARGANGGNATNGGNAGIGSLGPGGYASAANCGTINIYGGIVTATGGNGSGNTGGGAGIGGGGLGWKSTGGGGCGAVSIYGGTVTATGGNGGEDSGGGAGIGGGGYGWGSSAGAAGTLTLGKCVKLYQGTDNTGTVLDDSDSAGRSYSGSRPQNMFTEYSHTHSFTYTAGGNTITATCAGTDSNGVACTLEDLTATLTIVGSDTGAKFEGDVKAFSPLPDVNYYKANDDGTRGAALDPITTAPTVLGKYWAEITLGGQTAHVVYEIKAKASIGTNSYATLQQAIDAATDNQTIKLTENVIGTFTFNKSNTIVTLDLNGHTIDGDQQTTAITISNGTLRLDDTSTGKTGEITGAKQGVAVNGGTFKLEEGKIQGNIGNVNGAGVSVANNATFEMIGGAIQYNQTTSYTGGVLLYGGATFIMSGGAIQYNSGAANGFGGIGSAGAEPKVSGTAVIRNNVIGGTVTKNEDGYSLTGGIPCNYRNNDKTKKIVIAGALTTGAKIGVYNIYDADVAFTSGYNTFNTDDSGNKFFFSDDTNKGIHKNGDGELIFGDPIPFTLLDDNTKPVITVKRGETTVTLGAPQIGDVLTAETDATDLVYEWYRDNVKIDSATESTYTLTAYDLGKAITVKVYQTKDEDGNDLTDNRHTQTSAATAAVEKKTSAATQIAATDITVTKIDTGVSFTAPAQVNTGSEDVPVYKYEYGYKTGDATDYSWTDTLPISGLNPGTEYEVVVREKATADTVAGPISQPVTVKTDVTVTIGGTLVEGHEVDVTITPSTTGITYKWYIGDNTEPDGEGETIVPSVGGTNLKVEVYTGDPKTLIGTTTTTTTVKTLADVINENTETPVTITLDGPVTGGISIPADKEVILDIKGQQVSGDIDVPATSTLTITDNSNPKTGTIKGTVKANTGTVVIESGKFDKTPVATNPGTVTVKGGLFKEEPTTILKVPYEVKESGNQDYPYEVYKAYEALTTENKPTISTTKATDNTDENPQIGDKLTATTAAKPVTYQWYRDGVAIENATTDSYVITADDLGKAITVTITQAANAGGEGNPATEQTQTSTQTAAVVKSDTEKVDDVEGLIDDLPEFNAVTTNDKDAIEAAKAAYDALNEDQKAKVNADKLNALNADLVALVMSEASAKTGSGMTYTGSPIQLINAPTTELPEGYTIYYAIGESETTAPDFDGTSQDENKKWNTSIPTATNAGTYYVWYKVVDDDTHSDIESYHVTVDISANEISPVNPTKKTIAYSGESQELVTAGEASGGTMYYALGSDATTEPEEAKWSTEIPKAKDIGIYYVWYKAVGDENHLDSDSACVVVIISGAKGEADSKIELLPDGVTDTSVNIEKTPSVSKELTNEAKKLAVDNNAIVSLNLVVTPQGKSKATESETINSDEGMHFKVQSQFKDENSVSVDVLDISIEKLVNGASSELKETENVLEIGIGYDFSGKYDPVVIRKHDGTSQVFTALSSRPADGYKDATFYADTYENMLYIYSSKFSEYVIAYSEVEGNAQNRTAVAAGGSSSSVTVYPATVPVYRLFNTKTGVHFYTANKAERDYLLIEKATEGWSDEGIAFETAVSSGTPVYRVFDMKNGTHFYIADIAVRDAYVANGCRDEGIAWYGTVKSGRKVYKVSNPKNGRVLYTTSKAEVDKLADSGFTCEDAEFVVY